MWGGGYQHRLYSNGMPTSLGLVCRLIHCLRWGSVADKPRTSRCTIVSVGDITDCATSTAYTVLLRFTPEDKVYKCKFVWNQVVGRVKSENLATHSSPSLPWPWGIFLRAMFSFEENKPAFYKTRFISGIYCTIYVYIYFLQFLCFSFCFNWSLYAIFYGN